MIKRVRPLSEAAGEALRAARKDGPNSRVQNRAQAVYQNRLSGGLAEPKFAIPPCLWKT